MPALAPLKLTARAVFLGLQLGCNPFAGIDPIAVSVVVLNAGFGGQSNRAKHTVEMFGTISRKSFVLFFQ